MTFRCRALLAFVAIAITSCERPANAALPPLSQKELHQKATMIVTGTVATASVTTSGKGNFLNWQVVLNATIQNVEKGRPSDVTQNLNVHCWSAKSRPSGWAGPGGHYNVPAKLARFRIWLTKDESGNWAPLQPNGIELLDGHSALEFSKPDQVSKATPTPLRRPIVDEAYRSDSGTTLQRIRHNWLVTVKNGPQRRFTESGRDLQFITISEKQTGRALRISRRAELLQAENSRGEWQDEGTIQRTIPAVDAGQPAIVIYQEETASAAESPLPPDPSQESTAFLRCGKTWERFDLAYNTLVSRYAEEYRNASVIQLKAIVEHEHQDPHTLTIVLTESGGTVVLPTGHSSHREFRSVTLQQIGENQQ